MGGLRLTVVAQLFYGHSDNEWVGSDSQLWLNYSTDTQTMNGRAQTQLWLNYSTDIQTMNGWAQTHSCGSTILRTLRQRMGGLRLTVVAQLFYGHSDNEWVGLGSQLWLNYSTDIQTMNG